TGKLDVVINGYETELINNHS
ncbi:carbonic anhydrase, partial [Bacillus subtilis]